MSEKEKTGINDIDENSVIVPSVYREVFKDNFEKFCLSSGRVSGKSSILVLRVWKDYTDRPEDDIMVLQATTTEIKDSLINEIGSFLEKSGYDVGTDETHEWVIPKSKDVVYRRGQQGKIYFRALTDANGGQRTRGIKTMNKISLVVFEEAQKNRDANAIEQAIATFTRQLDEGAKIIVVGNNESVGHWFIDFVNEKKQDPTWCYIYSCYKDIYTLLNRQTIELIENMAKTNPLEYRRIYLGDIYASTSDVVFPQFSRDKNYKRACDIDPNRRFSNLFIGVDHATTNDTFAIVPVAILDDGTTQTLEVCYDDPQETNRTLAPTEQCDIVEKFVDFLDNKYGLFRNSINVIICVDGQATTFRAQLNHTKRTAQNKALWQKIRIEGFTQKKKDTNLGVLRNAFHYGVLTILNEGYKNWEGQLNTHRLVHEIESLRFKNGKLDPKIPNDLCDALEYGVIPYYSNCYNISFPVRMNEIKNNHYEDIRKIANFVNGRR